MSERKIKLPASFEVNRPLWMHGEGEGALRCEEGDHKMCCLGFLALACGYDEEDITGISYLAAKGRGDDERVELPFPAPWLGDGSIIANVNDNKDMTDSERERQLTEMFAAGGIAVKFVG